MVRILALLCMIAALPAAAQEMRGHGGPVRALAVTADGQVALSGSFDTSAILWSIETGAALQVLRYHDGAVNAVAALPDGRFATAGEEGRVAIWQIGRAEPIRVIQGHSGPIAALAVSPDGQRIASASWDGTARVTPIASGEPQVIAGHKGPLNAAAFTPDGRSLVTGSHDLTLRITPLGGGAARAVDVGVPVNALAIAAGGEIFAACADGRVHVFSPDGVKRGEIIASEAPLVALALSADGKRLAAAGIRGSVALIERQAAGDAGRVERMLVGPGLPVWSVAFRPGGQELLTGGGDRLVRRWDVTTGEHIGPVAMIRPQDALARYNGDRGAEVFRACVACHTLEPDGGNRAGPSLYGVIGRRIGTAPGYVYSPAFRALDIVWSEATIARLFEIGPNAYTPGTKMPEQIVADPDDRQALVDFIARVTARR
ncbi:c-type cytochrome [Phreatobacter stygius]|uniref:C-type cytochrome n=1 Tax=Phreatobacter stygius TaxID=1940610 RepID=A0A4D7B2Z6_9HYPH|nr:c-type cytochrome [Phreatobacter stygius]QCI67904.1 c-type cytochrome [Phreatobacter stygius]